MPNGRNGTTLFWLAERDLRAALEDEVSRSVPSAADTPHCLNHCTRRQSARLRTARALAVLLAQLDDEPMLPNILVVGPDDGLEERTRSNHRPFSRLHIEALATHELETLLGVCPGLA